MENSSKYTAGAFGGISLQVKPYCHSCPDFEADVDKEKMWIGNDTCVISTTIYCKHSGRCRAIQKYLSEQEDK